MVRFLLRTASGSRSPNCSRTAISSTSTCFQSGSAFNLLTDGSSSSGAAATFSGSATEGAEIRMPSSASRAPAESESVAGAAEAGVGLVLSKSNKFYTHFGSYFLEFDPCRRAFTFCRKTAPHMAMSMTEDDQGVIWSATYPQCGVVSFNPKSRELRDYGHLYKQDWPIYPRSVAVDDTGWVYVGLGFTATQIVALDAKTGIATPLMAEQERRHGAVDSVSRASTAKSTRNLGPAGTKKWFVLYQGHVAARDAAPAAAKPIIAGSQSLFHPVFPDGKRLKTFDLIERVATVEDPRTRQQKTLHFDYQSEGADVMGVAAAPDGTICGGTTFPMRFFRYDPKADRWTRHAAFGQWNTVARQGDRFFAGVYGGGGLLQWNPFADWVDTEPGKNGCNPAFLTDSAPTINRPHKLLAHPDGRTLVLAGTPGYGLTGGGLLFWDRPTATRVLLTHEKLIPQQSTMSLVALPDGKLLGGTTISPGTGGQYKADQAELYLLDLATKRIAVARGGDSRRAKLRRSLPRPRRARVGLCRLDSSLSSIRPPSE